MKVSSKFRSSLLVAATAAACSLQPVAYGGTGAEPCPAVSLSESDCGKSRCVMVFARVGERFRFELAEAEGAGPVSCAVGKDAEGEKSSLPLGLVFNAEEAKLEGVPLLAGFYEFVALREQGGSIQEQVVLIDIQGQAFANGSVDYATYVSGGVR